MEAPRVRRRDGEVARFRAAVRISERRSEAGRPIRRADGPRGEEPESALLKLMPVTAWARTDERRPESPLESPRHDEFHELMAGLSIPSQVAAVAYARGCRIRRVRVPAPRPAPRARLSRPVILSKRALHAAKNDQPSGA